MGVIEGCQSHTSCRTSLAGLRLAVPPAEVAVAGHHDPAAALLPVPYRAQAGAMTVILLVLPAYGSVAVITGTRRVIREMMLS
jgi:hypothetical protein